MCGKLVNEVPRRTGDIVALELVLRRDVALHQAPPAGLKFAQFLEGVGQEVRDTALLTKLRPPAQRGQKVTARPAALN